MFCDVVSVNIKEASNAVKNCLKRFGSECNAQAVSVTAVIVKVIVFRKSSVLDEKNNKNKQSSKRNIDLRVKFYSSKLYLLLSM